MKVVRFLFFCFILSLLINLYTCDSTKSTIQNKTITFSQGDQQFSIVPFYLNMPTYVKKAKENKAQIDRIYKKYVYDPIWDNLASKGECSFLAKNIKNPITDLDGLSAEIKVFPNSGAEEIIKKALLKVSKVIPGPNITIYLQVMDPSYKNMIPLYAQKIADMGIHADTYGTGKILISIDPTSKNWKEMLPRVLAHEYHHSIWISRNFESTHFSLLDCLMLEGRAEAFADLLYPNIEAPWPNLIEGDKEHHVWKQMKHVIHTRDEQLIQKMFIGDKDIPFLSVYSMGYKIMQEFIKNNPEVSVIEWTDMEPDEILSKSRYEDKFN